MGFKRKEAEDLLARTGRRCCLCDTLHKVQLHHIVLPEEGGTDDIDNAIPLCPNCHDEVHATYAPGRSTRAYTANELKLHRQRAIERADKQKQWSPGTSVWEEDKSLILFYAQCLDRPAFHTPFYAEMSFSAFDKAMEDTVTALNTGYWRTRDGAPIDRAKGKVHLTHQPWRDKMDRIVAIIEEIRGRFHEAFGLNDMLGHYGHLSGHRYPPPVDVLMDRRFRHDAPLGEWMDQQRQEAINIMNSMLEEIGHQPLPGLRD